MRRMLHRKSLGQSVRRSCCRRARQCARQGRADQATPCGVGDCPNSVRGCPALAWRRAWQASRCALSSRSCGCSPSTTWAVRLTGPSHRRRSHRRRTTSPLAWRRSRCNPSRQAQGRRQPPPMHLNRRLHPHLHLPLDMLLRLPLEMRLDMPLRLLAVRLKPLLQRRRRLNPASPRSQGRQAAPKAATLCHRPPRRKTATAARRASAA